MIQFSQGIMCSSRWCRSLWSIYIQIVRICRWKTSENR